MTALEQKKQEYVVKLQQLKQAKQARINQQVEERRRQLTATVNQQVEEYRRQLSSTVNHDDEVKIQNVIDSLQKVIEFESLGK